MTTVIPPSMTTGPAPKVPPDEEHLVPNYYRQTPFSSAWLRLSAIAEKPLQGFYGHHAFRKAPRLRGMRQLDQEKYVDKLVIDAEELRSMDTTIWEIRDAKPTDDSTARVIATSTSVSTALSPDPILLSSGRILHLSDLHFTSAIFRRNEHRWHLIGEGDSTLHARILASLGPDPKIGLVIISGDLTYWAFEQEFYEAFRFVHALLGALKLGPEHLVIVPGNHDIAWTKPSADKWNAEAAVAEAPEQATKAYRETLYERVYRHTASSRLGMARRYVCPGGLTIELGGLNTSALEQGKNWLAGMGRTADGAFGDVANTLGWRPGDDTMALRLLVLHHHVTATEDVLPTSEFATGFDMATDAKRTLRDAARHRVQLIMHGHRHQPYLGAEQVYAELEHAEENWALGRVAIIGAGSAGSTSVRSDDNYFNLLELQSGRLSLTMFRALSPEGTKGEFRNFKSWSALLTAEKGQLVVGDWEHDRG